MESQRSHRPDPSYYASEGGRAMRVVLGFRYNVSNSLLPRSNQPYLWLRRVLLGSLFVTVAVLWIGCGYEKVLPTGPFGYPLVGLVRDKETLEPLNKVLVGLKRPKIPDNALIDSSSFLIFFPDEGPVPNYDFMESVTQSGEEGYFSEGLWLPFDDNVKEHIIRLVAWKSGYRFWKYNARLDTISRLGNNRVHINIYMEKLDNQ